MGQRGFTLVELLLSMMIISVLVGLSLPVYHSFNTRNDLDITTRSVAAMLRRAQTYSRGVHGDSQWGVAIQSSSATLFKGATYASRDSSYDETATIPASMTTSGLTEIVYTKLSGAPSTSGNITFTVSVNDTRTINVNAKGTVSY